MRPNDVWLFSVVFGLAILSFLGVSGYARYRATAIDQAALDISENAAPSILYISKARVEVRNVQNLMDSYLLQPDPEGVNEKTEIEACRARIHQAVQLYQNLPMFPEERLLWEAANRDLVHLDDAIEHVLTLRVTQQIEEAKRFNRSELRSAGRQTGDALMNTIEFDAQKAHDRARLIRELRVALTRSFLVLGALCVLWTGVALLGFRYAFRRQAQGRETERRRATERAEELEQFAGRVAHDILNPLSVVTYALNGLERLDEAAPRTALLARADASVKRVVQILDGLLRFARAGAHPEPGACADVREVLAELEPELRTQAATASIELLVEPFAPCRVACSAGILISLVHNLAHNAIKYIGDGPERQIRLRVLGRGGAVRFEVEDNGPGLPPDLEKVIFEPWVRAKGTLVPGFGLGLATVKKAAEAHRGRVGVRSLVGRGCLFWFELPPGEVPPEP